METVDISGRQYTLRFEGRIIVEECTRDADHCYSYTVKYRKWRGHGSLTKKGSNDLRVFEFVTIGLDILHEKSRPFTTLAQILFITDKPVRERGYSLEQKDHVSEIIFSPETSTDHESVVDYLGELISQKLDEAKYFVIPSIKLPVLSIESLREKGLVMESQGQIKLGL